MLPTINIDDWTISDLHHYSMLYAESVQLERRANYTTGLTAIEAWFEPEPIGQPR